MATTTTEKPAATAEQLARKKAIKLIGYHSWLSDWRVANPESDADARKAAWSEVRADRMRNARRVVKRMEKSGLTLVQAPAPTAIAAE